MRLLLFTGQSLVFVPESDSSILPADGQGLENRVPLNKVDLILAGLDLKVGEDGTFFVDEDNARCVGCYG